MKTATRRVQRRQVVRQRRRGPAKTHLKPTNLPNAPLDLSRATYLSVPQAVEYLAFVSAAAFYMWVGRQQIPKCRTGRRLLFLRRDLDEAVQAKNRRAARVVSHA